MKYFVQVNRHLMINIEAETALRAEHAVLDLDGIQYANAFEPDAWKTDTFRGALLDCDTISFMELVELSGAYTEAWQEVGKAKDAVTETRHEVERLEELLKAARESHEAAQQTYCQKLAAARATKEPLHLEDE